MSTSNDLIAHTLKVTGGLLGRYCEDLKPDDYLHRPCGGANCACGFSRSWKIVLTYLSASLLEEPRNSLLPLGSVIWLPFAR